MYNFKILRNLSKIENPPLKNDIFKLLFPEIALLRFLFLNFIYVGIIYE